jgi:hypothetical protein
MRYEIDESRSIEKALNYVMRRQHDVLISAELRFLCIWRLDPKFDDGKLIMAEVSKMSNRDRDIYGSDVRLEVDKTTWDTLSKEDKIKVIDHELMHIALERVGELPEGHEENGPEDDRDFKYDKDGRLCFYMLPHDLDIRRFRDELMRYGLSEEENEIRKFLNKVFKEKGLTNYPDQASPDEEEDEE